MSARLGAKQVDHRNVVAQLRDNPGAWLPVGEYRTRDSANFTARAISTGQWGHNRPSPYTPGEYETDTELTEFGVRVLARYTGHPTAQTTPEEAS